MLFEKVTCILLAVALETVGGWVVMWYVIGVGVGAEFQK